MNLFKKIKIYHLFFLLLFILLTVIYFSFPGIITTDSTRYHICAQVLRGTLPITDWHVIRGPVMPFILFLSWLVFGDTPFGFLITSYLFFLTSIFFFYLIIKEVLKQGITSLGKYIIFTLFILLFVFNPLIIGYFHVMLTEFVAITIALVACFLSIKWVTIEFKSENRLMLLIYSFVFVILTLLAWFLKQPYLIIVVGPFCIATILSISKSFSLKNIVFRISVFIFTFLILFWGIVTWNKYLSLNVGQESASMEQESLADGFVRANSNFRPVHEDVSSDYDLYEVLDISSGKVIDTLKIQRSGEDVGFSSSFDFLRSAIPNYPLQVIHSYYMNYMSLINVNRYHYREFYSLRGRLGINDLHGENENIGLAIYFRESTFLGSASGKARNMEQYEFSNTSRLPDNIFRNFLRVPSLFLFKFTFLLLPIAFTFSLLIYIYLRIKKSNERNKLYILEILIILFGFSLLHVFSHVITGAIVDRYTIVAYPTALLGMILLFSFVKIRNRV